MFTKRCSDDREREPTNRRPPPRSCLFFCHSQQTCFAKSAIWQMNVQQVTLAYKILHRSINPMWFFYYDLRTKTTSYCGFIANNSKCVSELKHMKVGL